MNLQTALSRMPAPGVGAGMHPYLMVCANIAIREGIEEDEAVRLIFEAIPEGTRRVSEKEVRDTVIKSMKDKLSGRGIRPSHGKALKTLRMTTPKMLERFMHPEEITVEHFIEASPIVFDYEDPKEQTETCLYHLFEPDDFLYIGEARGTGEDEIFTRDAWLKTLRASEPTQYPAHICWNTFTGYHAKTQDGKDSLRCDNAIKGFKYAIVEFDSITIDDQLRFWAACKLPVAALVFSGSKSIHGILKITGIETLDDWRDQIQKTLYKRQLAPLGVDAACSNASRLSRLPGAFREKTEAYQKLIYLNPNATPLNLKL